MPGPAICWFCWGAPCGGGSCCWGCSKGWLIFLDPSSKTSCITLVKWIWLLMVLKYWLYEICISAPVVSMIPLFSDFWETAKGMYLLLSFCWTKHSPMVFCKQKIKTRLAPASRLVAFGIYQLELNLIANRKELFQGFVKARGQNLIIRSFPVGRFRLVKQGGIIFYTYTPVSTCELCWMLEPVIFIRS